MERSAVLGRILFFVGHDVLRSLGLIVEVRDMPLRILAWCSGLEKLWVRSRGDFLRRIDEKELALAIFAGFLLHDRSERKLHW